jgi:hypothetical protein
MEIFPPGYLVQPKHTFSRVRCPLFQVAGSDLSRLALARDLHIDRFYDPVPV